MRPGTTKRLCAAGSALLGVLGISCGTAREAGPAVATRVLAPEVTDVTALVPLPGGSVRVGVRASGVVEDVSGTGTVGPAIATVDVRSDGQRGLLGLAVDATGRTFASWTRPDGRLVVGQVAPGPIRLLWDGPPSANLANGGHLAFRRDRLVIGIGDLTEGARKNDLSAINGKLVTLDPDGLPDQQPKPLSSGWNNPFAFTVFANGAVWVADNVPGESGERLVRGDIPSIGDAVLLPKGTAPAGIDHLGSGDLIVCGYKSGALLRYRVVKGRPRLVQLLATDCRTATAVLADGRIVYAAADGLRVLTP